MSARHPEVTLRSVSSMTGTRAERKRIVELRGPTDETKSFLAESRRADPVVSAEPISPIDGGHAYVALTVDTDGWEGIGERLSDLGVHFQTGTTISGGIERWTVYLDAADDLSALIRGLERGGNDVELARNVELSTLDRSPKLPAAGILDGLTDRQREALATAIAIGYYDHGGGIGVEDVAGEFGVGSTTAWKHLSQAEETVMNALLDRFEEWGLPGERDAGREGETSPTRDGNTALRRLGSVGFRIMLLYLRVGPARMNEGTVSVPDEQYERLAALAAARGVSPETQLARLIDDAYEGLDGDAEPPETLPLGVCGDEGADDAG